MNSSRSDRLRGRFAFVASTVTILGFAIVGASGCSFGPDVAPEVIGTYELVSISGDTLPEILGRKGTTGWRTVRARLALDPYGEFRETSVVVDAFGEEHEVEVIGRWEGDKNRVSLSASREGFVYEHILRFHAPNHLTTESRTVAPGFSILLVYHYRRFQE